MDFPELFNDLQSGITELAKNTFKQYAHDAITDGYNILNELSTVLHQWKDELAKGELRKEDFEYNLLSAKDLIDMVNLKQAGLSAVKADEFKNAVFDLILNTVLSIIP